MGVDFGGEKINYQDLAFQVSTYTGNGALKLFGILGSSYNNFLGAADSTIAETQKDFKKIDFNSNTRIIGSSYFLPLNHRSYFKNILAASTKETSREGSHLMLTNNVELDDFSQIKISDCLYHSISFNKAILKTGSSFTYNNYTFLTNKEKIYSLSRWTHILVQPFSEISFPVGKRLKLDAGVHVFIQPELNVIAPEPRIKADYLASDLHHVFIHAGRVHQVQHPMFYLSNPFNKGLLPSQSDQVSIGNQILIGSWEIKTQLFYQHYTNLVTTRASSYFSSINYLNENLDQQLINGSSADSYGIESTISKEVRSWYFIGSAGYSKGYSSAHGLRTRLRYNSGWNLVSTAGKRFNTKHANRSWRADIKVNYRNGFNTPDMNQSHSALENNSLYIYNAYTQKLADYFRVDLRWSHTKNKKSSTVIWSVDIQNATSHKNMAYLFYDEYKNALLPRYQLGIIPVLSYRVMF
jgi:hypothetical protein